jgi:hypothetical protein
MVGSGGACVEHNPLPPGYCSFDHYNKLCLIE